MSDKSLKDNIPVIFLHGAGGSLHVWANQLMSDIPGYCQMTLDLPGHARSQCNGEEFIQNYVSWVIEFINAMGISQCILAGHSMGGAITQLAALEHPDFFKAIILVGTGARLRVAEDVLINAKQGEPFTDYAYSPSTTKNLQQEAEKEFNLTSPQTRYYDFLACDRFDIMQRLQNIKHPVLIICGHEDKLTPVKYSNYLHENLQDSRLATIPDAGHMVMWEQAEEVNKCIKKFLLSL